MKRSLYALCLILFAVLGCRLPQINLFNKVVRGNEYDLKMDNSYFAGLGCFESTDCLPEELKALEAPIGIISEPGDMLGGLTPTVPLAAAMTVRHDDVTIPAVYVKRCLSKAYIRYLIAVDGEMRLIDSLEGLAAQFAPIDSEEEALSYAIAATGFSAVNDLHKSPKPKLYAETVEETYVKPVDGGYVVHLFNTYLCGCGPHIARSVNVTVHMDGSIELSEFEEAFSDPELDGMCID